MLIFIEMSLADTLFTVRERIRGAAARAGRKADDIKLVAVCKTVDVQRISEAMRLGISIFGENRVQEAREKISTLRSRTPAPAVEWHLIGSLQKNKAGTAVRLFDVIQSLDSVSLAEVLNSRSRREGKRQRVLVQVNLSDGDARHGVPEATLVELLENITVMENLKLEGLMVLPPFFEDPEMVRPYFRKLKEIADMASQKGIPIHELSMGMSHDFEVAIEEGATMVRIGTLIFGERPVKP